MAQGVVGRVHRQHPIPSTGWHRRACAEPPATLETAMRTTQQGPRDGPATCVVVRVFVRQTDIRQTNQWQVFHWRMRRTPSRVDIGSVSSYVNVGYDRQHVMSSGGSAGGPVRAHRRHDRRWSTVLIAMRDEWQPPLYRRRPSHHGFCQSTCGKVHAAKYMRQRMEHWVACWVHPERMAACFTCFAGYGTNNTRHAIHPCLFFAPV
mgnify:CR=1 FL=1